MPTQQDGTISNHNQAHDRTKLLKPLRKLEVKLRKRLRKLDVKRKVERAKNASRLQTNTANAAQVHTILFRFSV